MTLDFPNRSRSYDESRHAVRFIGHDGMFEVVFFVEANALARSGSGMPSEADCLTAFDAARSSIHDMARKAYSGRRGTYVLTVTGLR